MAIRLKKDDLPRLADILSSHLPSSLKIYGSLMSTLKRGYPLEFWVDQWPDVSSVTAKKVKQDEAYMSTHTVFSFDKGSPRRLLETPGVVDWGEPVLFSALSVDDLSIVEELGRKHDCVVQNKTLTMVDVYYMEKADPANKLEPPDDLTLGTLSIEHAQMVKDFWKHGNEEPLPFFEELVQSFPNLSFFDTNGDPAAYEMIMYNGSMGFLFVQPEHRRKGLARYLTNALAQKVLDMEEIPFVFIERDNEASVRLHESAGFHKVSGSPMVWVQSDPKNPS